MVALSREAADYRLYAPDKPQMHTINHLTGEEIAGDNRWIWLKSQNYVFGMPDIDLAFWGRLFFPLTLRLSEMLEANLTKFGVSVFFRFALVPLVPTIFVI